MVRLSLSSQDRDMWLIAMKTVFKDLQMAGILSDNAIPFRRKPVSAREIFEWKCDQSGHVFKAAE